MFEFHFRSDFFKKNQTWLDRQFVKNISIYIKYLTDFFIWYKHSKLHEAHHFQLCLAYTWEVVEPQARIKKKYCKDCRTMTVKCMLFVVILNESCGHMLFSQMLVLSSSMYWLTKTGVESLAEIQRFGPHQKIDFQGFTWLRRGKEEWDRITFSPCVMKMLKSVTILIHPYLAEILFQSSCLWYSFPLEVSMGSNS